MKKELTEKEFEEEKKKLFALSKNKGLDQWEIIFKHYNLDIEKAKTTGLFVARLGGYIKIYFDTDQDKWLYRVIDPSQS
jgi:hypothetical protein